MEEENKFKSYIENAPIGVFVTNEEGIYIDLNKATSSITGFSEEELVGKKITDITPKASHKKAQEHFEQVLKSGKASDVIPFLTKNGKKRYWSVDAAKISDTKFIVFVNDITEQHNNALKIRELKEKLEYQVTEKTLELQQRIRELEHFHDVTIEREIRMKELSEEIERLKKQINEK